MNNLFAGLASRATGAASSSETPQDIPKEELMTLCMKMNKRMQAMETKGKELVKKKTVLLNERQKLLDLLGGVVPLLVLPNSESDLDLSVIEQSWTEFDAKRKEHIVELESKIASKDQLMQQSLRSMEEHYKKQIADLQAALVSNGAPTTGTEGNDSHKQNDNSVTDNLQNVSIAALIEAEQEKLRAQTALQDLQKRVVRSDAEVERFKGVEAYLKKQLQTMEAVISSKNSELDALQKELESNKTTYEEKVVYLQMQMNTAKGRDEGRDKEKEKEVAAQKAIVDKLSAQITALQRITEEKELSYKSNKELIQALQTRLMELEPELAQSKDKIAQFERNSSAQAVMKAEHSALAESLRSDLKTALDELEAARKRSRDLEEFKVKAEGQLLKLGSLSEQVQGLQSAIEEKDSLITRMRAEQQGSERHHAMRTAMLATCEAQLEELKAEAAAKESTSKEAIERVTSLQAALAACEARLAERVRDAAAEIKQLEEKVTRITQERDTTVRTLEKSYEESVEAIKRDHAKKSAMARTLLSEKEEEVRTLSAKVAELHEEISSGAPTERKIFELALSQAKRENLHGVHNDTREIAFVQLQTKLAAKDLEVARAQQNLAALQAEVLELRRTHQREGINMDYLKNIVIQYMTFPAQSSEKMSLVPVLAMLLQFTPKELSTVQRVAILEPSAGSLWGSLGLGGSSGAPKTPIAMPVFNSSRPAKEVKRPSQPITSPGSVATPPTSGLKAGTGLVGMSPATTTAKAALSHSKGASAGVALSAVSKETSNKPSASGKGDSSTVAAESAQQSYRPPVQQSSPGSASNSDPENAGTYSPPQLPGMGNQQPFSGKATTAAGEPLQRDAIMVESHTDTGNATDPDYATPRKAAPAPSSSAAAGSQQEQLGAGSGSFSRARAAAGLSPESATGKHYGYRSSQNRLSINRASSMNASDYEFQQKLKSIGSDILSLDNSMSYDDAELDLGETTYVDYEDGIEEGDELDDGLDGTSV